MPLSNQKMARSLVWRAFVLLVLLFPLISLITRDAHALSEGEGDHTESGYEGGELEEADSFMFGWIG